MMMSPMSEQEHHAPDTFLSPLWRKLNNVLGEGSWWNCIGFDDPQRGQVWFEAIGFSLFAALVLIVCAVVATRRYRRVPRGLQNIMEAAVGFIRGLVRGFAGPQGDRYVPYLGTVFLFVFTMNILGIIPAFRSPTMTLSTTAAIGITTFFMVQAYAIRDTGVVSYLKHFMGDILWLAPLMLVVEIIGELARPMSLSLRLYGNIFGEDNVIEQLLQLGPMAIRPLYVPLMLGFAIFTSLLQAFIFTTLSTIYIATKVVHEGRGEGEHEGGEDHDGNHKDSPGHQH